MVIKNVKAHIIYLQGRPEKNKSPKIAIIENLFFSLLICSSGHGMDHGLWTPNQGTNQRYLKNWADVADKI